MEQYPHSAENLTDQRRVQKSNFKEDTQNSQDLNSKLSNKLYRCGHCDMYDYLDNVNLSTISKSIVLLSSNHYFFRKEELKGIEMVVDIQNLSTRKNIESYLNRIHSNIQDGCYFAGCFEAPPSRYSGNPDYHKYLFEIEKGQEINYNGSGNLLGIIDKMINRLKISLTQNLSRADAERLFIKTGFNVMDMTEINGKIYFSAIKKPKLNNHYSLS